VRRERVVKGRRKRCELEGNAQHTQDQRHIEQPVSYRKRETCPRIDQQTGGGREDEKRKDPLVGSAKHDDRTGDDD
jgi:hypothetical protein